MLRKLIKYEWIASIRSMLPIYTALLVVAVINMFAWGNFFTADYEASVETGLSLFLADNIAAFLQVVLIFIYIALMVGLFVVTLMVILRRFWNGLLKDEGYLMFTLPVKAWQLALSKAVVAFLISMISLFVAIFAIAIIGGANGMEFLNMMFIDFPALMIKVIALGFQEDAALTTHAIFYGIELILFCIISAISTFYGFYLAMSLGQMHRSHRVAFSVVWYLVLNVVESFLVYFFMLFSDRLLSFVLIVDDSVLLMHIICLGMLLLQIIVTVPVMAGTHYILGRKLNLE